MSLNQTDIIQALRGFLADDKAVRTQANDIVENGSLDVVLDALCTILESSTNQNTDQQEDIVPLAAILLRKRLIKNEEDLKTLKESNPDQFIQLRTEISGRMLAAYQAMADPIVRKQLVNALTAICGILFCDESWPELIKLVEVQLNGDSDRIIEALNMLERLVEYESVRTMLLSVGAELLQATHVALNHDDPRIHSQAAKTSTSFLTYFTENDGYADFCALIDPIFEVCAMKTPDESNLGTLVELLGVMSENESGIEWTPFIGDCFRWMSALHKVYSDEDRDDEERVYAMLGLQYYINLNGEWFRADENGPAVMDVYKNMLDTLAIAVANDFTEAVEDKEQDPDPQKERSVTRFIECCSASITALVEEIPVEALDDYLTITMQYTSVVEDPNQWARAFAGYRGLRFYLETISLRRQRHQIWQTAFPFWDNTAPLVYHNWIIWSIAQAQYIMIREYMELDPYLGEMLVRVVPFCASNLDHSSSYVRGAMATCLGEIAASGARMDAYPMRVMVEQLMPFADGVITKLLAVWEIRSSMLGNSEQVKSEDHQTALMEQADIFDAAGKWAALFAEKELPVQEKVFQASFQIIETLGSHTLENKQEGVARCMQTALQTCTGLMAMQFEHKAEATRANPAIPGIIERLVTVIVQLNGLVEAGDPFYCSAHWRQTLLECLGQLAQSGDMFDPFLKQTFPIFATPLRKEQSPLRSMDSDSEVEDAAMTIAVTEHGTQRRLKIDTSLWEDQLECLWGLRALLLSFGAENLVSIGQDVWDVTVDFYKRNGAIHPGASSCYFVLGACLRHISAQVARSTLGIDKSDTRLVENVALKIDTLCEISRQHYFELGTEAEESEEMVSTRSCEGPVDVATRAFLCLAEIIAAGFDLPVDLQTRLCEGIIADMIVPACNIAAATMATAAQENEEEETLDELTVFYRDVRLAMDACLRAFGPFGYQKLKQAEVIQVWTIRYVAQNLPMTHNAICCTAFTSILGHGGEEAVNDILTPEFVGLAINSAMMDCTSAIRHHDDPHEDVGLRDAACTLISYIFETGFHKLDEAQCQNLLNTVRQVGFEHPEAKDVQRRLILDASVFTFILHGLRSNASAESVLPYFEQIPIVTDEMEVERFAGIIMQLFNDNHAWTQHPVIRQKLIEQMIKAREFRKDFTSIKRQIEVEQAVAKLTQA